MRHRKIQSAGYGPPSRSNYGDFGRRPFFQALIDLAALSFGMFLVCVAAAVVGAGSFILLFVKT
jgi:hypothetical protein